MSAAPAATATPAPARPRTMGQEAQRLARWFWVLPLLPGQKKPFGETPGSHMALRLRQFIAALWAAEPRANIGIATGRKLDEARKVIGIDVDAPSPSHGAADGRPYVTAHPTLFTETVTALTPTGGEHRYYAVPADLAITNRDGMFPRGINVRGEGGLLVAPPSLHPDGGRYQWAEGAAPWEREIADAPPALLALLCPPADPAPAPQDSAPVPSPIRADLSDSELLAKARRARNGAKFAALFDHGSISGHGDDDSAADEALACILTWWTNHDMARVERLFGQSALARRDKWQRKDYRRLTLSHADDTVKGGYTGQPIDAPPADLHQAGQGGLDDDPGAWIMRLQAENTELRAQLEQVGAPTDVQIARLTQERNTLQAWKDRALDILFGPEAQHLEISDRLSIIGGQRLVELGILQVGAEVTTEQKEAAAVLHISPATAGRWLDNLDHMDITQHQAGPDKDRPILDRKGRQLFAPDGRPKYRQSTRVACNKAPFEVQLAVVQSRPGKNGGKQGGRQPCPGCGAEGEKQEIIEVRHCKGCGAIYHSDGTIIKAGQDASQNHHEIGKDNTDCTMASGAAPDLRTLADETRANAATNPKIAAKLHTTRARLHRQEQDAAVNEHRHTQVTQCHDDIDAPPRQCKCPPWEPCSCHLSAKEVVIPPPPPERTPVHAA